MILRILSTSMCMLSLAYASMSPAMADYVITYEQQMSSALPSQMLQQTSPTERAKIQRMMKDPAYAFAMGKKVSTTTWIAGSKQRMDMGSMHTVWDRSAGKRILIDDTKRVYLVFTRQDQAKLDSVSVESADAKWTKQAVITQIPGNQTIAGVAASGYRIEVPANTAKSYEIWLSKDANVHDASLPSELEHVTGAKVLERGVILSLAEHSRTDLYSSTLTIVATSVSQKAVPPSLFRPPSKYKRQNARAEIAEATANYEEYKEDRAEDQAKSAVTAADSGDVAALRKMAADGVDFNRDYFGHRPLVDAIDLGHPDAAKFLLDHGASPDTMSLWSGSDPTDGRNVTTPLDLAVEHKDVDLVSALLEHGANPNSRLGYGSNALIIASAQGLTDIVKVLLAHGADPLLKDDTGDNAITSATNAGEPQIAEMLRAAVKAGKR